MHAHRDFGSDLEGEALAGVNGFADALTLGTGDYAGALTGAVFGGGVGSNFMDRKGTIPGGGRTIADLRLKGATPETPGGVEAKFGPKSKLSNPQQYARRVLEPQGRYHVDHWLTQDVAKGIGGLLGVPASQASSNRNSHK
jgi:hypothetical protein